MFSSAASSRRFQACSSSSRCRSSSFCLSRRALSLLPFGDVLVRADQSAIGHRPAQHGDAAPVGEAHDLGDFLAEAGDPRAHERLGVHVFVEALGGARLQDLAQRGTWLHLLGSEAIELGVAVVGDQRRAARHRTGTSPATCSVWRRRSACSAPSALPRAAAAVRSACASCAVRFSRSVMSWCVLTHPPSPVGRSDTLMMRPSPSLLVRWLSRASRHALAHRLHHIFGCQADVGAVGDAQLGDSVQRGAGLHLHRA